jgi:plasmid maintenance system antidote protein VapI
VNDIVRGKRAITAGTAQRLAKYFGTSPEFWMNLQTNYDLQAPWTWRGRKSPAGSFLTVPRDFTGRVF